MAKAKKPTAVAPKEASETKAALPKEQYIGGKRIVSVVRNGSFYTVIDAERTVYTLPKSEYDSL